MTHWLMVVAGGLLAAFALFGMFVAGSDMARIRGVSPDLVVASAALMIAALLLEYHA